MGILYLGSKMSLGVCKLCDEYKELQKSHAIGNAVFKKISKNSNGRFIKISLNNEVITQSIDSWATKQLCRDCEKLLNVKFEKYALETLREKRKGLIVNHFHLGISFNGVDQQILMLYFFSIYWRAAHSNHPSYKELEITSDIDTYLKSLFICPRKINHYLLNIKISALIDKDSRVSREALKHIISSPFLRLDAKNLCFCLVFEGYFIEIFFSPMSFKQRNVKGFLDEKSKVLFVPYVHVLDIPELEKAFRHMVHLDRLYNHPFKK